MAHGVPRSMVGMAIVALLATTLLYLFSLQHVTDSSTPATARYVHGSLERSLADGAQTSLVVAQMRTADGKRHYVLRIEPAPDVAADERTLAVFARRAAELTLSELADKGVPPVLTCVLLLPREERRITWSASLQQVPEPPPPAEPTAAAD